MIKTAKSLSLTIHFNDISLEGEFRIPYGARRMVIFSNGSLFNKSMNKNYIPDLLYAHNFGSVCFDLISERGNINASDWFSLDKITTRLVDITKWMLMQQGGGNFSLGYFSSGMGASVALKAAAVMGCAIRAVVSSSGLPVQTVSVLKEVKSPVLFIAGERDASAVDLNQRAFDKLNVEKKMELIPGAYRLLDEPEKLHVANQLAMDWFEEHL